MSEQRCRILVVDDSADNLFLLQAVLESSGYKVELAEDGSSALDKIFASPPDLVLLDMMMPQMNGFEVTQRLRQDDRLCSLPVVLITAYGEELAQEVLTVGANDWMGKPIDFDELLHKVEVLCDR